MEFVESERPETWIWEGPSFEYDGHHYYPVVVESDDRFFAVAFGYYYGSCFTYTCETNILVYELREQHGDSEEWWKSMQEYYRENGFLSLCKQN